jgi:hypothetical protein
MNGQHEPTKERQRFEVGDEVIGDGHIRGVITGTNDIRHITAPGHAGIIREYLVKSEKGEQLLYAGEVNLRLVKKGMGDAAQPRADLLKELDEDLRRRPLAGLRL